jgi:hypothetical protein
VVLDALCLALPALPPSRPMFHDPIEESSFKADVIPSLFALNPLMAQNLLALGQELLIKHRIFYQFCCVLVRGFHLLICEFVHLRMGVNQIQDFKNAGLSLICDNLNTV